MTGAKPINSFRNLFKIRSFIPFSKYIFSLMKFIINNLELFQISSSINYTIIWNKNHLHRPFGNLSCF